MSETHSGLTRTTLAVLVIGVLIVASLWILWPFLPAAIWATMIAVATWPLMLKVQSNLWNARWLAVIVMTLALILVFVAPLALASIAIAENEDRVVGWVQSLSTTSLPPPPPWLEGLPLVGPTVRDFWNDVAAAGFAGVSAKAAPYAGTVTRWFVSQAGSLGLLFIEFLLTVIFATIMYAKGEHAALIVQRFGYRLAGERGEMSVRLAGLAIRGVALGVVVTAVTQAVIGGVGLAITGIPFASVLTAVMFILCVAQIGPGPVLIPAVIWIYWTGHSGWGTLLLIWTIGVMAIDNTLRPVLIKRSVDLPLLLIFIGVIGGLIAFGLVGIFVGPVVLAVAYTLLIAWVGSDRPAPPAPPRAAAQSGE
ncbi:MAG TPA: AI-2E family transporter YdiK [Alphaproteobacteria bacterium]|nr:AI-2E family transporter YdiK [Alphaproteobacteria bacterium]